MSIEQLSTGLAFILIIGGLLAILFPFAPSVPTVWFGIFLYAISHDFVTVNQSFMVIVSIITVATIVLDYTLSRGGVQRLRAGPWGVLGAVVGGLIGSLINPITAYLVGPIIGAVVFETLKGRDQVFSYKSGNYTIVAFMGGTIIKLLASIAMIGLFVLRLQGRI
jgi:uncharacterized protein YqgC (DUF456 family)